VRLKRPGLMVRARNGYYEARSRRAPKPSELATTPLAETIGSPLPVTGVPMKVFAAPYKGQAPNAAIAFAVEVDVNNFEFVEKDGIFNEELDVYNTATDAKGKTFPGDKSNVKLTMKPDTYARVKSRGLRMVSQASLPPGRYQMRFAASNKTGKTGSVLYD